MLKTTWGLLAIGIIPFGIIFLFGQELFIFVFGKEWADAGNYAQILCPWLLTGCINPPSTVIYTVLQKQKIYLFFIFMVFLARSLVFLAGIFFSLNAISILIILSNVSAALNILMIIYAYKLSLHNETSSVRL